MSRITFQKQSEENQLIKQLKQENFELKQMIRSYLKEISNLKVILLKLNGMNENKLNLVKINNNENITFRNKILSLEQIIKQKEDQLSEYRAQTKSQTIADASILNQTKSTNKPRPTIRNTKLSFYTMNKDDKYSHYALTDHSNLFDQQKLPTPMGKNFKSQSTFRNSLLMKINNTSSMNFYGVMTNNNDNIQLENQSFLSLFKGKKSMLTFSDKDTTDFLSWSKLNNFKHSFSNLEKYRDTITNEQENEDLFFLTRGLLNDFVESILLFNRITKLIENQATFMQKMPIDDIFFKLEDQICSVMECEHANIFLYDKINNVLWTRSRKSSSMKLTFRLDSGVSGWVASNMTSVVIDNVTYDQRYNTEIDNLFEQKTKSIICAPIIEYSTSSLVAVAQVINKKGNKHFDTNDEKLFQLLAKMIKVQIQNSTDMSDYTTHEFKLTKLLNNVHRLYHKANLDSFILTAIDIFRKTLAADVVSCVYKDVTGYSIVNEDRKKKEYKLDGGLMQVSVKKTKILFTREPTKDKHFNPKYDIETNFPLVTFPVCDSDDKGVLSVFQFEYRSTKDFDKSSTDLDFSQLAPLDNEVIENFIFNFKNGMLSINTN